MLKEAPALLPFLALSVALHVGGIVFIEAKYGAPDTERQHDTGQRHLPLRAFPLDVKLATRSGSSTESGPNDAAPLRDALPVGTVALPGPYYFLPQELSRRPLAAAPVPLEYPENAPIVPKKHVVLRLLISEAGDVDKIIVETADVPGELEQLARRAFAQAKFQPGLRGNVAVKSQMLVEITFEAENTSPPPAAMLPSR